MTTAAGSLRMRVVGGVIALALVGVGAWFWVQGRGTESTDDAFVQSDIVTVVSGVQGSVTAVRVGDNAHVERGAGLVTIDAEDLKLTVEAATAQKDAADAQLEEVKAAGAAGAVKRKEADAAVQLAEVRVEQAQLALSKAEVTAPVSGRVTHRMVAEGDTVRAGQPLVAIVGERSWVVANLKETQLARVKVGDAVEVEVDAYPELKLKGHVDSVQAGAGQSFSLLPPENASGNFVKVVQRVPVKVVLDTAPARELSPGLSARVRIHVR